MSQIKCFIIIDYNNTRFEDVRKMSNYLRNSHFLKSVLIRKNPTRIDLELADIVMDQDWNAPNFVETARHAISKFKLSPVGGLVFSDRAMIGGSQLLDALGLNTDTVEGAYPALDKSIYRQAEQNVAEDMEKVGVWIPRAVTIKKFQDALSFFRSNPDGVVLKPTSEGNNRGVTVIHSESDLEAGWENVLPYLSAGVIAEAIIPFQSEYSFDGVGGLEFVTRKISAHCKYPVEFGQQVPSGLSETQEDRLKKVGREVCKIVGSKGGAFHNEIRFDGEERFAVVEPNRRPAGMSIWNLAQRVYGFDFFKVWIDHCLGIRFKGPKNLTPLGVATIRMLKAPYPGYWNGSDLDCVKFLEEVQGQWKKSVQLYDFKVLKTKDAWVGGEVRNNSDFLAHICAFTHDMDLDLQNEMNAFESSWSKWISQSGRFLNFEKKLAQKESYQIEGYSEAI